VVGAYQRSQLPAGGRGPRAHSQTSQRPDPRVGARFTAAAVGLQDVPSPTSTPPAVATAFLRSANPQLDDTSPLLLLRAGDPDEVQKPLLAATRAFLEG